MTSGFRDCHTEWSKSDREGEILYDIPYMQNLKINGFPDGSDGEESACNVGDLGLSPGLGRSPRGEHGNPLLHSCLEGTEFLASYSSYGHKDSDMTEVT